MLDIAVAWEQIARTAGPLASEEVDVADALGRVPAQDAVAAVDLPPFDRSAMDGYAVRAADTASGATLRLTGDVAAGADTPPALEPGSALGISTGAALPPGADAVLQSELAIVDGDVVEAAEAIPAGRHVRRRGEDVRAGDVLAPAGRPVTLQALSALASAGVARVSVHRRPRMHVLVTGSELLPLGAPPEPGRIHESNGLALRRLGERAGAVITGEDRVPDDADATRSAVARALDAADVVVVTGGVSVGPHDHVRPALTACGVEEVFWRVRLRPGKPLWFGTRGETLVFGLPGNPLSAIVCFLCFLEPALRRLQGEPDAALRTVPARLAVPAEAGDGRTTFLTSALRRGADGVLEATPDEHQGSHLTGALAKADGFVVAPHDAGVLPAGALVQAVPLA